MLVPGARQVLYIMIWGWRRSGTEPLELIPEISTYSIKLIGNKLDLLIVYIALYIPSERITINIPLNHNTILIVL
jgi:hypothetical protein